MQQIDRQRLVSRHNPTMTTFHSMSPLSVGNGEFAFTADLTGLQTYPERYEIPLGTQSAWGWHSSEGRGKWGLDDVHMQLRKDGRGGYPIHAEDREEPFHWLRQNPHRLQLGQIGFRFLGESGSVLGPDALSETEQTLDLWSGIITSKYRVEGVPVIVQTACHPSLDQLSVTVDSPLLADRRLEVIFAFPAPGMTSRSWDKSIAVRLEDDGSHRTEWIQPKLPGTAIFERKMDDDGYRAAVWWNNGRLEQEGPHTFVLREAGDGGQLEFTAAFTQVGKMPAPVSAAETLRASREHWRGFWSEGGAIELAESRDPRALELERRIVLSQFLTAIHCSGSTPPQETGLLYNSWYGKFHLEMHWWHAFHFPLWGRAHLLRRSMGWYRDILPVARELARSQGYSGARWPKMVAPDGIQSPSPIGPLLIWQQPHPIVMAELLYLAEPTAATLREFGDIVLESAEFMASFAEWEEAGGRYVLGPPVIPAQERHKGDQTWNPTYELEYWRHGLETAIKWADRLGRNVPAEWARIRDRLSALPQKDGIYLAHENAPETYTKTNTDHPSMFGAYGMLPGVMVDEAVMRRTLHKVKECWKWETTWGWDYPMAAMTAARLGEGEMAVDFLLMDVTKNTYLPNGHNYQRPGLMAYLPGNGGLLTATAMMACGWNGAADGDAPGFPKNGQWTVRREGLHAWM